MLGWGRAVPDTRQLCLVPRSQAPDYTSATRPKARVIRLSEIMFFHPSAESSGLSLARESMLTASYTET